MSAWHTDAPPVSVVLEVWDANRCVLAVYDGHTWHTPEGAALADITHWRWVK